MFPMLGGIFRLFGLLLLVLLLAGCGGGGDGGFTDQSVSTPAPAPEPAALTVTLQGPAQATVGTFYTALLQAAGGTAPYTWSILSGVLPPGIGLEANTGVISGTTSATGTFNFVVQVRDSAGSSALANLALAVVLPEGTSTGGATASNLNLLISSPDLPSSGQQPVTLTAIARDNNGVLTKDVTVAFQVKSGDGTIQVIQGTTDETGTAQALLSTGGNQRNRTIIVGASAGAVLAPDLTVNVTGTTLEVSGATSGTIPLSTVDNPNPVRLTFALKNSAGVGIPGATLVVTGAPGGSRNLVTNASGLGEVNLQFSVAGEFNINAFWDSNPVNASTTTLPLRLIVSNDFFTIAVRDAVTGVDDVVGIDPPITNFGNITVTWSQNGVLVSPANITLSTNKGNIVVDNPGGNPLLARIRSSVPGSATITATGTSPDPAISPVTNQRVIQFIATEPDTLTLQANPSSIAVNVPPSTSSQSTIVATVRDAVGNPVANVNVAFEITQDVSGGSLSSGTARTNFSGQASVVYVAGTSSTPENGVIIRATVTGLQPRTVNLTVSRREVFITLGTGNTILEPDVTTYALPYNVLVNDIVGGAVPGAVVTLNTVPAWYRKGQYRWNGVVWVPVVTASCENEDLNNNGILDLGEDVNANDRLDPGNVVTTSVASITTDQDGFGRFDVLYAQQYANWIDNVLTARTRVGGSESEEKAFFVLPANVNDLNKVDTAPPGQPSPFGVLPKCEISVEREASLTLTADVSTLLISSGGNPLISNQTVGPEFITVTVNLPGAPVDLTGTSVFATANSADSRLAITVPARVVTTGADAQFGITVTNISSNTNVPLPVQAGTVTFQVGSASLVIPVEVGP